MERFISCIAIIYHSLLISSDASSVDGNNQSPPGDTAQSQHILVCSLLEMASLLNSLGATALPLVSENQNGDPIHFRFSIVVSSNDSFFCLHLNN